MIRFVENSAATAKVTFNACAAGSAAVGFDACASGCTVSLCPGSIHHALGRVIGLWPEQRRSDRDHYVRVFGACTTALADRCATADNSSDFGPFDFDSTMFSFTDAKRISRWNAQPLCSAPCEPDDRPPSVRDGSAVIELYQLATRWTKFRRLVEQTPPEPYDPAALTPFIDEFSRAYPIARNASPAMESWPGESMAIYVRAVDDVLLKTWLGGQDAWYFAQPLQPVPGLGDVSDPAITSWAAFRNDTIVRRGGTIYITSHQVDLPWESLGSPDAIAASSPAITTWGENRLDIVVRAHDDRVYHKFCSADCAGARGSWSEWAPLEGGIVRGKPAIVSRGPGLLDVFVHGTDGRIWTIAYTMGGWGTWSPLPVHTPVFWDEECPDCASPAAGARAPDTMDVYVRGADNRLWNATWSAQTGWTDFIPRGGDLASSPATSSTLREAGQADVFAIMLEDHGAREPYRAPWWKSYRTTAPP